MERQPEEDHMVGMREDKRDALLQALLLVNHCNSGISKF